jgi:hypothetical protein
LHAVDGEDIVPLGGSPLQVVTTLVSSQQITHHLPSPSGLVLYTSTRTIPIPKTTTNTLENARSPTPATSPNTLPKLTCRIVCADKNPADVDDRVVVCVLPCFCRMGSLACMAQPLSGFVCVSGREYGAVYWHCIGAARKGERGWRCRVAAVERPMVRPRPRRTIEGRGMLLVWFV